MVEDLARLDLGVAVDGLFMLLMEPVVAGDRVLTAGSSSVGATLETVVSARRLSARFFPRANGCSPGRSVFRRFEENAGNVEAHSDGQEEMLTHLAKRPDECQMISFASEPGACRAPKE